MSRFPYAKFLGVAVILVLSAAAHPVRAEEHPEHPMSKGAKPTACLNATPSQAYKDITMPRLSKAIQAAIAEKAKAHAGYFTVYDRVDKKTLSLKLLRVHKDKLAKVDNGLYFACTDMKSRDGKVYDLDFFMQEDSAGNLGLSQVSIHKKQGVPRYDWAFDKKTWRWKQIPLHGKGDLRPGPNCDVK